MRGLLSLSLSLTLTLSIAFPEIVLASQSGSIFHTSDADFNGTFSQTALDTGNGRVGLTIQYQPGDLISSFGTSGAVQSNPSSSADVINSIAVDSNYIYTAGYDGASGSVEWRIEKRNKTTGDLISAFGSGGVVTEDIRTGDDVIYSVAVDSSYIYIAGISKTNLGSYYNRMEKRDITTGALVTAFNGGGIVDGGYGNEQMYKFVTVDSSYVYIGGGYRIGGTWPNIPNYWIIEKRDITTGALVTAFDGDGVVNENLNANAGSTHPVNSIMLDSNYLYAVGTVGISAETNDAWRVEKRDKATGALITAFDGDGILQSDPTTGFDIANASAIDASYIYLAGYDSTGSNEWRIEKRNITSGALVAAFDTDGIIQENPTSGDDKISSIAIDASYIYLAGYDSTGSNEWRIEKRNITTGALVNSFGTSGVVLSNASSGSDISNSIVISPQYVYAAGMDSSPGNNELRIEKRSNIIAYYSSGTYTSTIFQRAQVASWGNLSYTKTGTGSIAMRARSCSTASESSCQHYGDGWSYCGTINSGDNVKMASPNCASDSDKFIQYQATLSGDTTTTPYLEDVTLDYQYNPDQSTMWGTVKFFGTILFK